MIFLAIANIYAIIAKFVGIIGYCPRPNSRYSVMVCMCLGRAPHSPRYVQTSTQHSPNSLALLVLSTAKFTLFSHGLHTFGKSPTFPKIRANIDATIAEFVGVVGFVHGQIHAIWSVLSSRHLRPIPHKSFTLTKWVRPLGNFQSELFWFVRCRSSYSVCLQSTFIPTHFAYGLHAV